MREKIDDAKLLLACKTISKEIGYILLINKYKQELRQYILSMSHSIHITNDVLQSTYETIWKNIDKIEPLNFKRWIFKIAVNHLRSNMNEINSYVLVNQFHEEQESRLIEEDSYNGSSIISALKKYIRKLSPSQQYIFNNRYFGLKTDSELANELKITVSGVRSGYTCAQNKIKKMILHDN